MKHVIKQNYEICKEAVKQSGWSLFYVKEQTKELCSIAINNKAYALTSVKEQTRELCLIAIRKEPLTLKYVREQTEEMCLEAVKRNGMALKFVDKRTEEICIEALKQDKHSILYIDDKEKYLKMFSDDIKFLNSLEQLKRDNKYKFAFSNIEFKEAEEEIQNIIAIKEDGKWLFTLCNLFYLDDGWKDMSKGRFIYKIYNEEGGYNIHHRVNLYRQIYLEFLENFN
ncbi:DUF4116 domain-containing protein [Clostridioides difficile]|uniref:DUF4116 domain-containing protein n=1 Tax=Clostridioides difficile TaxID=1496 RepID=UPI001F2A7411|nr:DUF4116 domain-containing protein [Clostridioides difficile]